MSGGLLPLLSEAAGGVGIEPWKTGVFAAILGATLLLLATEKIHKTVVALGGGLFCLILGDFWGLLATGDGGHAMPVYVELIGSEWEVIGLVFGATVFVEIAARSGVFSWVSIRILKFSTGDPFRLLLCFSVLTCVFAAFLDNITAMIIVGSLTVVACRKLELDPVPYIVTEGIMTNVGGLLTLISSIPNIIIGQTAGITYVQFLMVSSPYVVMAIAVSMIVCVKIFGSAVAPLTDPVEKERNLKRVLAFDEWDTVQDRSFFWFSAVVTVAVILLFAFHSQIPILSHFGIEVIAIMAAFVMMLFYTKDVEHDLSAVEWSLVFFFIGLFVIIGVMGRAGVLNEIGKFLAFTPEMGSLGSVILMWLTALFSSVTDNIPLAAMLAKIFGGTPAEAQALAASNPTLWWGVVFGANLGGNITPVGSASTVVAVTILKKNGLKLSFLQFVKIGGVFAFVQLTLASFYIFALGVLFGS